MSLNRLSLLCIAPLFCGTSAYSDVTNQPVYETGVDEQAQLPFWQISTKGMSLRLVQRLPIQSRGYFMARGFSAEHAEVIAQSCVFQTVFKNISDTSGAPSASELEYDQNTWVVISKGNKSRPKTREDWSQEWQAKKVSKAAQIAFEWSLYPTQQIYKPGDYNWGMTVMNKKPGTIIDIEIHWRQFGKHHRAIIKDVECAADVNPQPKESG